MRNLAGYLRRMMTILLSGAMILTAVPQTVYADVIGEEADLLIAENDEELITQDGTSAYDDDEDTTVWEGSCQKTVRFDETSKDDPDALLEGYINKLVKEEMNDDLSPDGVTRRESLSAANKYLYDFLSEKITATASGNVSSTVFKTGTINLKQYYGSKDSFTKEELGVSSLDSNEAIDAALEKAGINLDTVFDALCEDYPYDLYWWDKTCGYYCVWTYSSSTSGGKLTVSSISYTMQMYVSADYSTSSNIRTTDVDTTKTRAASSTVAKATQVVNNAVSSGCTSDYEKLKYYKKYICDNTTYNHSAAQGGMAYGNPWQLVYVFDGDPNTIVVCEGYSKAFKLLCDLSTFNYSSFDCYLTTGDMSVDSPNNGGAHMWNTVKMNDGKYYLVDVTNCDNDQGVDDDRLFLVGSPSPSATNFYINRPQLNITDYSWFPADTFYYKYDTETIGQYSSAERTIAGADYDPTSNTEPEPTPGPGPSPEPDPGLTKHLELIVWGGTIKNLGSGWTTLVLDDGKAIDYIYESDSEETITLPIPVKDGDEFDSWYLRDENNTQWAKKYTGTTYKMTEYAVMDSRWKSADTHKIRLFLAGGELSSSEWTKESYTGDDGTVTSWYSITSWRQPNITLPTPTKENCEFLGWQYWDKNANKYVDYTEEKYKLTADIDLRANWKSQGSGGNSKYYLELVVWDGVIENLPEGWEEYDLGEGDISYIYESDKQETINLPIPVKNGDEFAGWYLRDDDNNQWAEKYNEETFTLTEYTCMDSRWKYTWYDDSVCLWLYTGTGVINGLGKGWQHTTISEGANKGHNLYYFVSTDQSVIDLPTPVKDGEIFKGWYIWDEDAQESKKYSENTYKITKTQELSAWFVKPATGIVLDPPSLSIEEGKTVALGVDFTPEDQSEYPWITFTSSDDTIATVTDRGVITGKKEGTVTITASANGENGIISTTCTVTVTKKIIPVTDIRLSASSLTLKKDESVTLTASVLPEDATDKTVTWATGDSSIATVKDGVVTGVKAGTTAITAKADEKTAAVIVTVTEGEAVDEEGTDLEDLIKDTGDGEKLGDVIRDVVTTTTEDGKTKTDTMIWIGGLDSSYTYTGSQIKPAIHVYDGIRQLTLKKDYTVNYNNNKDAGTGAKITVKFTGNYAGTPDQTVNFTINKADLAKEFVVSDLAVQATGRDLKPVPEVKWKTSGKKLSAKSYKVTFDGNKDSISEAGTYTATITANDFNLTGTAYATVTVISKADKNRDLSKGKIVLSTNKQTWTGSAIEYAASDITVTDSAGNKVDSAYYNVSYINNTDPGKATLIVTANDSRKDGYAGSKSATFTINKGKTGNNLDINVAASAEYDPKGAIPVIIVTDKDTNTVLKEGVDYKVSYKDHKKAGSGAKAIITGKGNYKFTCEKTYTVTAKDISKAVVTAPDVFDAKNWNKSKLSITDNGKKLGKNDYKITAYKVGEEEISSAPTEGSVITINIKGLEPNYTGTTDVSYRFVAKNQDISKARTAKKLPDKVFTGDKVTLTDSDFAGVLTLDGKTLVAGTNFKIASYEKNNKKGTAKVTVVGINSTDEDGNPVILAGSKTLTFKIVEKTGRWKNGGKTLVDGEWTN